MMETSSFHPPERAEIWIDTGLPEDEQSNSDTFERRHMFRSFNLHRHQLMRHLGNGVVFAFLTSFIVLSQIVSAQATGKKYQMVTGQPETPAYAISVGISSLVKVQLMPSKGLDLDTSPTSGLLESFSRLRDGEAQFALLGAVWKDIGLFDENIQSVATLWHEGERSIQLLARRDVDDDTIYEITRAIFENLEFLKNIERRLESASLDNALNGMVLPIHHGAKRYFEQVQVLQPEEQPIEIGSTNNNADQTAPNTSRGKTFVIYFDFDEAEITEAAAAVLDEVAALTEKDLENATIWMAGYTDTYGDKNYNQELGQRRVDAVREGLLARGFTPPELYSSAFGERMTWIKTDDQTLEARNRRVEIFIEYHDDTQTVQRSTGGNVISNNPEVANEPIQPLAPVIDIDVEAPVIDDDAVQTQQTVLPAPAPAPVPTRSLSPVF
jgi:outer membrane protein OmpA-like peptidoglycan-associated protein